MDQTAGTDEFFKLQIADSALFEENESGFVNFYLPDGERVQFIIRNVPDDSGDEYKARSTSNLDVFYSEAAGILNARYELSKHYKFCFEDGQGYVKVELRDPSYGVFETDDDRGNDSKFKRDVSDYKARTYNNNISLRVRTHLEIEEGSDQFDIVGVDSLSFDKAGEAVFDASTVLDPFFQLDNAELEDNEVFSLKNLNRRFKIDYCEYDVATGGYDKIKSSNVFRIHKGGPNIENQELFYSRLNSPLAKYQILTNLPSERYAVKDQPIWVSILLADPGQAITKMIITLNTTDGQTTEIERPLALVGDDEIENNSTVRIPLGYNQLGLDALLVATQQVMHYTVKIQNDTTTFYSSTIIMEDESYQDKLWYFTNSFGVVEVFRARMRFGKQVHSEKGVFISAEQNTGAIERQSEGYGNSYTIHLSAGVGSVCKKEAIALIDLLSQPGVFLVENGKKIPYVISKGKPDLGDDDNGEVLMLFKAQKAFSETQIYVP